MEHTSGLPPIADDTDECGVGFEPMDHQCGLTLSSTDESSHNCQSLLNLSRSNTPEPEAEKILYTDIGTSLQSISPSSSWPPRRLQSPLPQLALSGAGAADTFFSLELNHIEGSTHRLPLHDICEDHSRPREGTGTPVADKRLRREAKSDGVASYYDSGGSEDPSCDCGNTGHPDHARQLFPSDYSGGVAELTLLTNSGCITTSAKSSAPTSDTGELGYKNRLIQAHQVPNSNKEHPSSSANVDNHLREALRRHNNALHAVGMPPVVELPPQWRSESEVYANWKKASAEARQVTTMKDAKRQKLQDEKKVEQLDGSDAGKKSLEDLKNKWDAKRQKEYETGKVVPDIGEGWRSYCTGGGRTTRYIDPSCKRSFKNKLECSLYKTALDKDDNEELAWRAVQDSRSKEATEERKEEREEKRRKQIEAGEAAPHIGEGWRSYCTDSGFTYYIDPSRKRTFWTQNECLIYQCALDKDDNEELAWRAVQDSRSKDEKKAQALKKKSQATLMSILHERIYSFYAPAGSRWIVPATSRVSSFIWFPFPTKEQVKFALKFVKDYLSPPTTNAKFGPAFFEEIATNDLSGTRRPVTQYAGSRHLSDSVEKFKVIMDKVNAIGKARDCNSSLRLHSLDPADEILEANPVMEGVEVKSASMHLVSKILSSTAHLPVAQSNANEMPPRKARPRGISSSTSTTSEATRCTCGAPTTLFHADANPSALALILSVTKNESKLQFSRKKEGTDDDVFMSLEYPNGGVYLAGMCLIHSGHTGLNEHKIFHRGVANGERLMVRLLVNVTGEIKMPTNEEFIDRVVNLLVRLLENWTVNFIYQDGKDAIKADVDNHSQDD